LTIALASTSSPFESAPPAVAERFADGIQCRSETRAPRLRVERVRDHQARVVDAAVE
jgi:hypothetical protein